mgnify:FL=1
MSRFRISITRRSEPGRWFAAGTVCAAIGFGFVLAGCLFALGGVNPLTAIARIIMGSFGSLYGLKETLTKSIPLILCSSGLILAFRARFWNIGAEGQLLAGAVGATFIALRSDGIPGSLVIPAMFVAGAVCGAFWAWIPGILRFRLGVNEVISTLMLNYIIAEFVQYLVYGPWKGSQQFGFPYTDNFHADAVLTTFPGSRIHLVTLGIALICAALVWMVMHHTTFGFSVRAAGESSGAARYAGIHAGRVTVAAVAIGGAMAGLAGVGEVAGIHHHLSYPWSISSGYGYTAIIAAWLARLNPLTAILSSIFLSGILVGGDTIQTAMNLPAATVNVFNGAILFSLIGSEFFMSYRIRIQPKVVP